MQTIEFETQIQNGAIRIPSEHQQIFGNSTQVKVILLKPDTLIEQDDDMIAELLNHPLEIDNLAPATRDELYDR